MIKYIVILVLFFGTFSISAQTNVDRRLAIEYFKTEQYEKAISRFNHLYKKSPTDEYYNYLRDCYLSIEDLESAEKVIQKHIKKSKGRNGPFYIDLGYILMISGKTVKAQESFNQALSQIENNPGLSYSISKKFNSYGYNDEALRAFEIAESNNPNMAFHYQKALIYAEMGDLRNMYEEYLNMIHQNPSYYSTVQNMIKFTIYRDQGEDANSLLKELLIERVQSSDNVHYSNLLVWLLVQEKKYGQAFIQLKALDKRLHRNQAEIYNLGNICMKNKAWKYAHQCYDYIIKKGDQSTFYELSLIQSVYSKKEELRENPEATTEDYQLLIVQIDEVIDIIYFPDDLLNLKTNKAHILAFKLSKIEEAITLLKESIGNQETKRPGVAACKLELGDILLSFGDPWDALMYYAQVDKAFPEGETGQMARFKKAMVAFYLGDFDWAKAQFDILKTSTTKFIANDAMNMSIVISDNTFMDDDSTFSALKLYAKARLLIVREDLDSAEIILDSIANTFPIHSLQDDVMFEKANIYMKKGMTLEALDQFKILFDRYPTDLLADESLYNIAKLYEEKLGDFENAMKYYEILFSDHGDSLFASQARDAYRRLRGDDLFN